MSCHISRSTDARRFTCLNPECSFEVTSCYECADYPGYDCPVCKRQGSVVDARMLPCSAPGFYGPPARYCPPKGFSTGWTGECAH